ncbi:uncharacterized protein At4g04775-like [Eutrema salsugineum]|uniref:uncharacterized protein At4g04775-like n=1 Tax=Eutrema salsugineum TaxID=72664 RepID=UPI000CED5509|nr:uncharacterized protein At4g04775-like [Eutrema salsugineum]
MEKSQSSGSVSSNKLSRGGPVCKCGRSTTMLKAWTNENPGRRFFKCDAHGFVAWADEEKPYGWQKMSLLEARDEIRHNKEEIKLLKESVKALTNQAMSETTTAATSDSRIEEEKKKLEYEIMVSKEREKMMRQFIIISWDGFIIVVGMFLAIKK